MAKLAIKGDKTRGDQVLTILKMLGGTCIDGYSGAIDIYDYFIRDTGIIDCTTDSILNNANYKLYTIDEFWAEFPYKVGDKVHILCKDKDAEVMSANWDSNMECVHYCCLYDRIYHITARAEDLLPIAKEDMDIAEILKNAPKGTKLYSPICGKCELNHINNSLTSSIVVSVEGCGNFYFTSDGKYHDISNAECLLFPSKDNRDWSTFKVEPQFPTSYKDCCEILGAKSIAERRLDLVQYPTNIGDSASDSCEFPYHIELNALFKLLICRDAWWKVDNDWNPNWGNNMSKYNITTYFKETTKGEITGYNHILAFRTKEIRDKFLDTFIDLIEQCKELI